MIALVTHPQAKQAQFYQKPENYGVAVASTPADVGVDFVVQISAPVSYGWAAVGTGRRMKNSLMLIIYPSERDDGQCQGLYNQFEVIAADEYGRHHVQRENRKVCMISIDASKCQSVSRY